MQSKLVGRWVGLRETDAERHSVDESRASATLERLQGPDIVKGGRGGEGGPGTSLFQNQLLWVLSRQTTID